MCMWFAAPRVVLPLNGTRAARHGFQSFTMQIVKLPCTRVKEKTRHQCKHVGILLPQDGQRSIRRTCKRSLEYSLHYATFLNILLYFPLMFSYLVHVSFISYSACHSGIADYAKDMNLRFLAWVVITHSSRTWPYFYPRDQHSLHLKLG